MAPVVVIGFKRPDLIRSCLGRIVSCRSLGGRPVRVYLDGFRNEHERSATEQTAITVESFRNAIPGLEVVRRNWNFGCRQNIADAITATLVQYGRAIIVEEDVCISPSFLEYMDAALDRFSENRRIWCINGYVSPWMRIPVSYREDVFLDRRNAAWGWGTWLDRWMAVDFDLREWKVLRQDDDFSTRMEFAGRDIRDIAELQAAGKINTWDIQCTIHMIRNGLHAVSPRYSLTKNIGFGTDCENCVGRNEVLEKQKYYDFIPRMPAGELKECRKIADQFREAGSWDPTVRHFFRRLRRKYCHFSWSPSHNEPILVRR